MLVKSSFDYTTARPRDIHFAIVIHLPFRLRMKSSYHCDFEYQGYQFDLWTLNRVEVPERE